MEKIKGYRTLSALETAAINECKDLERKVLLLIETFEHNAEMDKRYLDLATERVQEGFMWMVRAIARPE